MPSLSTEALGSASLTYWYAEPEQTTPILVSAISTRLRPRLSISASRRFSRASTATWRPLA